MTQKSKISIKQIREYILEGGMQIVIAQSTQTDNVVTIENNAPENLNRLTATVNVLWNNQGETKELDYGGEPWQMIRNFNGSEVRISNTSDAGIPVRVTLSYVGDDNADVSPIVVKWWDNREFLAYPDTKIIQVKITIHTGNISRAGTDANVYFRINNGDWWLLDKSWYNDFEAGDIDTYGPFDVDYLTVGNISQAPIELRHDDTGIAPGWYVEWLNLEAFVVGYGWITYQQYRWLELDSSSGTYCKLQ